MSKSLPLNDFGISILVENTQKIAIEDVIHQHKLDWQKQLTNAVLDVENTPVTITQSKLSNGGTRLWFVCPQCSRRCGTLFQHPISNNVGCRNCLGVKYRHSRYKNMIEGQATAT